MQSKGLAEHTGLEPIPSESKTEVLPLHQCSILKMLAEKMNFKFVWLFMEILSGPDKHFLLYYLSFFLLCLYNVIILRQ